MVLDGQTAKFLKAYKGFISDLSQVFGGKDRKLAMYNRLLEKTTEEHENPIQKHLEAFTKFYQRNRETIIYQKPGEIEGLLKYNDRVYINIGKLLRTADKATQKAIMAHLVTLGAILEPEDFTKEAIEKSLSGLNSESPSIPGMQGGDLFGQLLNTMGGKLGGLEGTSEDDIQNVKKAVHEMVESGIIENMVGTIQESMEGGNFDMTKLMSGVAGAFAQMDMNSTSESGVEEVD